MLNLELLRYARLFVNVRSTYLTPLYAAISPQDNFRINLRSISVVDSVEIRQLSYVLGVEMCTTSASDSQLRVEKAIQGSTRVWLGGLAYSLPSPFF